MRRCSRDLICESDYVVTDMRLLDGLRLDKTSRLAIVGAGGKSTILFNSAKEFGMPVVLAATAHLCTDQLKLADTHLIIERQVDLEIAFQKPLKGITLLTGPVGKNNRTRGIQSSEVDLIWEYCDQLNLPLLVEADGSRRLPLKAPAEHEPPIPEWVNQVVVVVGLSALGKPVSEETIFRAEKFAEITGSRLGERITFEIIISYLLADEGGLKNILNTARKSVFFNQLDQVVLNDQEKQSISRSLLERYHQVIWGNAAQPAPEKRIEQRVERVAGIILAAGGSQRFGKPKQLLEWRGKPFIWHVVQKSLQAGLQPIVVVTGAYSQLVENAISDLPVMVVHNPHWEMGLSTSVKCGLAGVADQVGAAVFLMSDVPQVPQEVIERLVSAHPKKAGTIYSTASQGQLVNPVLFDRRCFEDLLKLEGERGGKVLFNKYSVEAFEWENSNDLRDIDREEDYEWLRTNYG